MFKITGTLSQSDYRGTQWEYPATIYADTAEEARQKARDFYPGREGIGLSIETIEEVPEPKQVEPLVEYVGIPARMRGTSVRNIRRKR